MAVAVVPSRGSRLEDEVKHLELHWQEWTTCVKYDTGVALSAIQAISLYYGPPFLPPPERHYDDDYFRPKTNCVGFKEAFVGEYNDPGTDMCERSHGQIKIVAREVLRDLGFTDEYETRKMELEFIEALLGDDSGDTRTAFTGMMRMRIQRTTGRHCGRLLRMKLKKESLRVMRHGNGGE
jgi:hypothetical protein